jgi:hypothetical protein
MPLQLLYSELYHYYSHIWKLAIIIVSLPDSYHFICLKQHRTHLQIVVFSYSPKYPFHSLYSMTCGPTQSSPSSHLPTIPPGALNRHRHQGPSAEALQRVFKATSTELGLAVASMGAAHHRALQGSTTCPSEPLDSVQPACTTAWSLSERPHVRCRATGGPGQDRRRRRRQLRHMEADHL